jgi:hypothetical protein
MEATIPMVMLHLQVLVVQRCQLRPMAMSKFLLKRSMQKRPWLFHTFNGNVDVTFPATLKANVKLKSDQGDIYSDFDIDADKTQPKVKKQPRTVPIVSISKAGFTARSI